VAPAAWPAAVDTGAGALGLSSDEKALAAELRPSRAACKIETFDEAGGAPTFTPQHWLLCHVGLYEFEFEFQLPLRRGKGEWCPLLLKSNPGPGPLSLARKKGALTISLS
jgi:hypothetical protein